MVVRANALQRAPGSDVVPAEIAGQHDHAVAALEHADVDRDRRDGAEEGVDVVRVVCSAGATSGLCRRTSSRKSPTIQTKIPEFQR